MTQDQAEIIALQALAWLVGNEDLLPVFLGATGADTADMAARADQPDFQVAVLDFLMMDDAWVIGFCRMQGLPPDSLMRARQALPGGAEISWT